jgi:hypothetical protein
MQRLYSFECHDTVFLLKLKVNQMRLIEQVKSICSHVIRKEEQWHEEPILHLTECATEFDHSLIRRYPLFILSDLEERSHIVSVGNHFVNEESNREEEIAKS